MRTHPGLRYLRSIIRSQGILYAVRPLPVGLDGVYYEEWGQSPRILIAPHVRRGRVDTFVSILGEEVGHFYRAIPNWWPPGVPEYTRRLHVEIQEARARAWAARKLVTRQMRRRAIAAGLHSVGELAAFWRVTPQIAAEAVRQEQAK